MFAQDGLDGRYFVFSIQSKSYIELSKAPGVSQSNDAAYPRHQHVASHARIQEFSSEGVQVSLTKKALTTFFLVIFYHFQGSRGGPTFFQGGGGGPIAYSLLKPI